MAQLLELGALQISPPLTVGVITSGGYVIEACGEGGDFGSAVSIETTIETLIRDGAYVVNGEYVNREATFLIRVRGNSSAMATAEAQLFGQIGKRNTLSWTPADGFGSKCIFQVWASRMEPVSSDQWDILEQVALPNRSRVWRITLTCAPFAEAATLRTVSALTSGGSPSTSTVDACSSTSGWTGSSTVTVVSGMVGCDATGAVWLSRSGAVSMTGTPYLVVTWQSKDSPYFPSPAPLTCLADGAPIPLVAEERTVSGTVYTYKSTFYCADTSVTTFRFENNFASQVGTGRFSIDLIEKSNQAPVAGGGGLQKNLVAEISGSARTEGTIHVTAVGGLGDVLVYAYDRVDGKVFQPNLRPRRTAGGAVTSDSAMVSGGREDIVTAPASFLIPHDELPPGRYVLMVRVKSSSSSRAIPYQLAVEVGGVSPSGATISGTTTLDLPGISHYYSRALAAFDYPLIDTPLGASSTTFNLKVSVGQAVGGTCLLDEAWLFNLTTGALVQVACGSGTPTATGVANHLWITNPDVNNPNPGIFVGSAANKSNARYPTGQDLLTNEPALLGFEPKTFTPPDIGIFTSCAGVGVTDHTVDLTYPERHHTHVP